MSSPLGRYLEGALSIASGIREFADAASTPAVSHLRHIEQMLQESDQVAAAVQGMEQRQKQIEDSSRRWAEALAIVHSELPKRGWYLTGREPATMLEQLADDVRNNLWGELDRRLIEQAGALKINLEALSAWLSQRGVAECCIRRVCLFLQAYEQSDHESATLVGVPTIDELSRYLFEGKDFTTKRGKKQPKPQMACITGAERAKMSRLCQGFVDEFGLVHEDIDTLRLNDEDYFNRSAIVHGKMKRSYGSKDSAKCFMVMMYLIFASDSASKDNES